jgi:ATP-binding cassette subfamily C protein LapB
MHEPDPQPQHDETGDPLLDCLVILTTLQQQPCSAEALRAGLPLVNGRLTPSLFVRAAERAGFSAGVVKRPLARISPMVLPAVLLFQDGQACVLAGLGEGGAADVMFPETGLGVTRMPLDELVSRYSGYAVFVKPVYRREGRDEGPEPLAAKSWFWGTVWRQRREYLEVILAALMVNLFALAVPLFVQNVYNRVVPNATQALDTLWVLATGAVLVFGFDFLARTMRGYFIDQAGKKADVLVSSALFQQVMGMQLKARPASSGAFVNTLREFETVRDFFTSATLATVIDLPFAIFFIWVISIFGGPLFWVPLLALPVMLLGGILARSLMSGLIQDNFATMAQKHGILVEAIEGIETVKVLGAEGQFQRKWEEAVGESARSGTKSRLISTLAVNFTGLVQHMVTVVLIVWGVYMIGDHLLTMGGLIACNILSGRAMAPLAQMATLLTRFQQAKTALASLDKVMMMPQERPIGKTFVHRPTLRGDIEFDKVVFKYPGQPAPALDGVSFRVAAGERIGVLGRIGSGKSTMQKLILGLYQPDSGAVLVDGTDVTQIDPVDLRKRIGYVSQDARLFLGTLRENITMGAPFADDETVLRAAQLAGVDRFANRHPQGFAMPIGEQGTGLSGGQRQAVSIARALLSDPPIVVLDEPTSATDQNSEQAFIRNMKSFLEGKTLVLATHKPAMLELVDRLIVLEAGKVVMEGPKDRVLQALAQGRQPSDQARKPQ